MKHLFLILSTLVIVWSCSTDDDPQTQEEPSASFNRQAMLVNWADKIIVPAYRDFQQSTNELQRRTVEFTATPNEVNLATLRNQWITSYRAFQKVSMFEIGRAEQLRFRDRMNTYPVNVAEVENISYRLPMMHRAFPQWIIFSTDSRLQTLKSQIYISEVMALLIKHISKQ